MTKVTLTKVFTGIKETKFGNKMNVGLKIQEDKIKDINGQDIVVGDRYVNGWFKEDFTFPYSEGDVVDLLVVVKGEYLNFSLPGVGKPPAEDTSILKARIKELEAEIAALNNPLGSQDEEMEDPDGY